jgi:hypothetical protein
MPAHILAMQRAIRPAGDLEWPAADQSPLRGLRRPPDRRRPDYTSPLGWSKFMMALLELGQKGIAGTLIDRPNRIEDWPDRDRLAIRFEQF